MNLTKWKHLTAGFLLGGALTLSSVVLANPSSTVQAWITANVSFFFNGVEKELPTNYTTLNYGGHTYVPARFIAEELGADVKWDESQQSIHITKEIVQEPTDQDEELNHELDGNKDNEAKDKIEKDINKYHKLPQTQYVDRSLITVKGITIIDDYTAVTVEISNKGEIPIQLNQSTAILSNEEEVYKQKDISDKILYPFDQTWFNDIREDETKQGLIKLPVIPEDTKYVTLEFDVIQNDASQKTTKLSYDIALD